MENPIKMDDLGVPLFLETPISTHGRFVFFFLAWRFLFRQIGGPWPHLGGTKVWPAEQKNRGEITPGAHL